MVFTAGPDGIVPGWLFLVICRIFVGVSNAGIYTIDLPLVQEFIPAYKRGWVSALVTTMLPAGSLLAGFVGWQLLPIVGWRGLFPVGLVPLVRTTGACTGYRKDHIKPLACGGADAVSNIMQWQTVTAARAKDRWEPRACGR